jgi:hypothetical protein
LNCALLFAFVGSALYVGGWACLDRGVEVFFLCVCVCVWEHGLQGGTAQRFEAHLEVHAGSVDEREHEQVRLVLHSFVTALYTVFWKRWGGRRACRQGPEGGEQEQ